jgi:type VI secretion system protein ImpH
MSPLVSGNGKQFTQALLARAPGMNFFQLCHLLERQQPDALPWGTGDTPKVEPVRFRPWPTMGFPAADIAAVEYDDERPNAPPTVRTRFMGLYGVDAAMPAHLIDDIALRRDGHEELMAFLDQFNHRVAILLFRAWKKYRYTIGFRPGATDQHSQDLLALVGFGIGNKPERAGLSDSRVLALLGPLSQRTRTADGLAGVVALVVPGIQVTVEPFHPSWVSVTSPAQLGSSFPDSHCNSLRRGAVLGRQIVCRNKVVRVLLRPATVEQIDALLPGERLYRDLMAALRLYMGGRIDVLLRMEVSSTDAPQLALGEPRARLGWTSLLKPASKRAMSIPLGCFKAFLQRQEHSPVHDESSQFI